MVVKKAVPVNMRLLPNRYGSRGWVLPRHRFQGGFDFEKGAEASFEFCNDGKLRGYRAPAHPDGVRVTRQEFVCLGEPATITDEALGDAIADFLE
jgi:hypothetical protein